MDDPEHYMYRSLDSVPEHPVDGTFAVIVPVRGVGYLAVAWGPAGEWTGAGAAKTPAEALVQLTVDKLELEEPVEVEPIPIVFPSLDEAVEDFGDVGELELGEGDVPEYEPEDPSENTDSPS